MKTLHSKWVAMAREVIALTTILIPLFYASPRCLLAQPQGALSPQAQLEREERETDKRNMLAIYDDTGQNARETA